jgi:glycosyltransferase involved in cell wall biosynthesis
MNQTNTISVIITTFNRKKLLDRAIGSVLQQTRPADEVICIDDGSTDGTNQMIVNKFPQVHYFSQMNQGISSARNAGIKLSKGAWLAFLDSDDTWHVNKLEKQMRILTGISEYLICHTDEIWIRNGRRVNQKSIHRKFGGNIYQKCLPLCIISPSSVVIHRSVFQDIGQFDGSMPACEDYDLWLRICSRYPVYYQNEPLISKYGGHTDQLSKRYWGMDRFRIYALEKMLKTSNLSMEDKLATLKELVKKIDVYLTGCRKRKRFEEVQMYQEKKILYQEMQAI